APQLVYGQVEHQAKKGRGGCERQAGHNPVRETFHENNQFQRRAARQKKIEGTILVISLEKSVETKQCRKQAGNPQNRRGDLAEEREIGADRESAQGDEDQKKNHAEAGAAADALRSPQITNEKCEKWRFRCVLGRNALGIFHGAAPSRSSWPARPRYA